MPSATSPYAIIMNGLACRCPRCGRGALFVQAGGLVPGLTLVQSCSVCHLAMAGHDSGDGPAVFLIFILGFTLAPAILLLSLRVDWPLWLHMLLWTPLTLGAVIALIRPAKAISVGLQYHYRRSDFVGENDEGTDESGKDQP
jgi:uncharacterized protein (DUF983 family)